MRGKRYLLYKGYDFLKGLGLLRVLNGLCKNASIMVFHRVNDHVSNPLTIPIPYFEKFIDALAKHYRVCSLQQLIDDLTIKKSVAAHTVAITFDDGYQDNFVNAAPLLRKYNLPATFFITSGFINTKRIFPWDMENDADNSLMDWDEVRELVRMGFEIGGHTINHANLGEIPIETAVREIKGCKDQIEERIGLKIDKFAFPFGRRNCIQRQVVEAIKDAGFKCCCAAYGGKVTKRSDPFNLYRVGLYASLKETLMDIDNYFVYFDAKMKFGIFDLLNTKNVYFF